MNNYSAGDIVCSRYNNFKGEQVVGIFLILYNENNDVNISGDYNVTALKCSSQMTVAGGYCVPINTRINNFMNSESLILTSKVHTLDRVQTIYKKLGHLDQKTMLKVYKSYNKYVQEVQRQMLEEV